MHCEDAAHIEDRDRLARAMMKDGIARVDAGRTAHHPRLTRDIEV